ncbi:hypothetical protein PtrM4_008600 [Pyrenophora tritici-repentis]|uniref:Uncharacterized protein n=1 Tax=Pyrenophora tritici-repentis TaxID=45151 RepID=A0A834S803_9PLEO|nr:hypothetical protein PtrM4_008600 [Pyrenophora tritici-repentis]
MKDDAGHMTAARSTREQHTALLCVSWVSLTSASWSQSVCQPERSLTNFMAAPQLSF